jgi:hypothetical protein
MDTLYPPIFQEIAMFLDMESLASLLKTCRQWNLLLSEEFFWERMTNIHFPGAENQSNYATWKDYFKDLIKMKKSYLYLTLKQDNFMSYDLDRAIRIYPMILAENKKILTQTKFQLKSSPRRTVHVNPESVTFFFPIEKLLPNLTFLDFTEFYLSWQENRNGILRFIIGDEEIPSYFISTKEVV